MDATTPSPCRGGAERGQASVELVALLPLIALVAAAAWQLVLVGQAGLSAAGAARAGARAVAVGEEAAPAARAQLPADVRGAARVTVGAGGVVRVAVPIRRVPPAPRLGTLAASARFEGGG
jgi:hypothetical protein